MNYELGQSLITQLFEILFTAFNVIFTEVLSLAIPALGAIALAAMCGAWVASHCSLQTPEDKGGKEEATQ